MTEWVGVWQYAYAERAGNVNLPMHIRLHFHALANTGGDGHAPQAPGELREVLSRVDKSTGLLTPATPQDVRRAISRAKEEGLLVPESNASCLIVPGVRTGPQRPRCWHAVEGEREAHAVDAEALRIGAA